MGGDIRVTMSRPVPGLSSALPGASGAPAPFVARSGQAGNGLDATGNDTQPAHGFAFQEKMLLYCGSVGA